MVNAVEVAEEVSGRSICARMLMKTVGRRDISGPEASFELSGLALWRCSRQFSYLSLKGSRRLERNGDTAISSSSLDKYLARPHDELCSWYKFASKNGKVPVAERDAEDICEDDDEENEPVDALQQPDWVDVYVGHNQCYEGVEDDFQYDDGEE
ncbi:hypothetical protein OS493_001143 [Desmophyllum pertusum]|uniref:Uncharacterized protein n=1 Tax=Desmophyllum pertusum TaxID=174260 RepID=A0A9W9ZV76_9CNID|nr:hypothetical protein OS493_001143 [Desmophyllum pertusum]